MSDETRILAGVLLLSLVTVETGGLYLSSCGARARGSPTSRSASPARATPMQACCWCSR